MGGRQVKKSTSTFSGRLVETYIINEFKIETKVIIANTVTI